MSFSVQDIAVFCLIVCKTQSTDKGNTPRLGHFPRTSFVESSYPEELSANTQRVFASSLSAAIAP